MCLILSVILYPASSSLQLYSLGTYMYVMFFIWYWIKMTRHWLRHKTNWMPLQYSSFCFLLLLALHLYLWNFLLWLFYRISDCRNPFRPFRVSKPCRQKKKRNWKDNSGKHIWSSKAKYFERSQETILHANWFIQSTRDRSYFFCIFINFWRKKKILVFIQQSINSLNMLKSAIHDITF